MNYRERLFRMSHGFRKGDDPVNSTQSTNATNQYDYRVGASESGVAVGAGGYLDQSFTDNSRTEINTTDARQFTDNSRTELTTIDARQDNRDFSSQFTDNSRTEINTTDARDMSDRRQFIDNSDRSFTDASQTTLNTYDQRDLSTHFTDNSDRSFTDASQTTLNTYDQRDQSVHTTDARTFTDNSVHYNLDADLARASLKTGADSLASAAAVLDAQIEASRDTAARNAEVSRAAIAASEGNLARSLSFADEANARAAESIRAGNTAALSLVGNTVENLLEYSAEQANAYAERQAALAEQQTSFLSSFYTDRENSDVKIVDGLAKSAAAVAIVGALAWALK